MTCTVHANMQRGFKEGAWNVEVHETERFTHETERFTHETERFTQCMTTTTVAGGSGSLFNSHN